MYDFGSDFENIKFSGFFDADALVSRDKFDKIVGNLVKLRRYRCDDVNAEFDNLIARELLQGGFLAVRSLEYVGVPKSIDSGTYVYF